jgi:hypothetical protein
MRMRVMKVRQTEGEREREREREKTLMEYSLFFDEYKIISSMKIA